LKEYFEMNQILLTNDDGIQSPGLWAAAEALAGLGFVHVAAPRDQFSGAGRSMPGTSDGRIAIQDMLVNGQLWKVHAVGGTPAQAVQHGILEILPERPALVVAGINYGENVGTGVTISGTVGAALEAAAFGVPAMAISFEVDQKDHYSLSKEVNFSAAAYFTAYFAKMMMARRFPPDVDILKIDVPSNATPQTPWTITRVSRLRYFDPVRPARASWDAPARVGYIPTLGYEQDLPDTDVYALRVRRMISVTPISLDMTSRIDLAQFENDLKQGKL
jgi:5'-nucleotidase